MATVTCHTAGCVNEGIPIEVPRPLDVADDGSMTGPPVDPWFIQCGPCEQPITDVVDADAWIWNPHSTDGR